MYETFRERLALVVSMSGKSDSAFSRSAGVAKSYVSQVKRGEVTNPGWDTVVKLAGEGKVDPQWLASGDGTPPAEVSLGWASFPPQAAPDPYPAREHVITAAFKVGKAFTKDVIEAAATMLRETEYKGAENFTAEDWSREFLDCLRLVKELQAGMATTFDRDQTDEEKDAFD